MVAVIQQLFLAYNSVCHIFKIVNIHQLRSTISLDIWYLELKQSACFCAGCIIPLGSYVLTPNV